MNNRRNRLLPTALSLINLSFWLLYRHQPKTYRRYPWTEVFRNEGFQFAAFLLLGLTAAWAFYAFGNQIKRAVLMTGLSAVFLCGYMKAYTLLTAHFKPGVVVYQTRIRVMLPGILSGALLFCIIALCLRRFPDRTVSKTHSLDALSRYRNHLMGIAMLYVMLFHTVEMGTVYNNSIVRFFIRNGYGGVDIFILLSGMGMVYSLTKDFNPVLFYKKRLLRIFPTYIPIVGAYTLLCMYLGICSTRLLFTNCTGLSFWFFPEKYDFNWYIPGILLFYLLTPIIYRLLKEPKRRTFFTALMLTASVFIITACNDFLGLSRLLVALTRFPIFLLGILIGFWILEKRTLNHSEYVSLSLIFVLGLIMSHVRRQYSLPLVGGAWLVFLTTIPAFCLYGADFMRKIRKDDSRIMAALEWIGKNSLLIYLLNVVLVRVTKLFLTSYFKVHQYQCMAYCFLTIFLNLALVYLVKMGLQKWKNRKTTV